jgi:hypothetical protein
MTAVHENLAVQVFVVADPRPNIAVDSYRLLFRPLPVRNHPGNFLAVRNF